MKKAKSLQIFQENYTDKNLEGAIVGSPYVQKYIMDVENKKK